MGQISLDKLHTPKLLLHNSLLPLKIKQSQAVNIYDRKYHYKTLLLSVENGKEARSPS
jgi:hypothetical protein